MIRFIAGLLFITAAGILIYTQSPIKYYSTPKQNRLYQLWHKDIAKLRKDPKFSGVFKDLSKVEVHFTDPQVAEEFEDFKTPFSATDGNYILRISVTRWIEKYRYGFVIQHELFDLEDDKLFEFGRTYQVGLIL